MSQKQIYHRHHYNKTTIKNLDNIKNLDIIKNLDNIKNLKIN